MTTCNRREEFMQKLRKIGSKNVDDYNMSCTLPKIDKDDNVIDVKDVTPTLTDGLLRWYKAILLLHIKVMIDFKGKVDFISNTVPRLPWGVGDLFYNCREFKDYLQFKQNNGHEFDRIVTPLGTFQFFGGTSSINSKSSNFKDYYHNELGLDDKNRLYHDVCGVPFSLYPPIPRVIGTFEEVYKIHSPLIEQLTEFLKEKYEEYKL